MQPYLFEELRTRIHDAGLEKHEALLLPHARLAFDMRLAGESNGALGESRWGGVPDVRRDFEWPHNSTLPLTFLGQINLADLIEDPENPFPASGLLQFFADFASDKCLVVLLEPFLATVPAKAANGGRGSVARPTPFLAVHPAKVPQNVQSFSGDIPPHRLAIEPRADLPQWATSDWDKLTDNMTDDERDAYLEAFQATKGPHDPVAGQLLGHVAGIGTDPREDAFIVREHPEVSLYDYAAHTRLDMRGITHWRNLATFNSMSAPRFSIGDFGYYNFLIHEDNLEHLDFSRVYPDLQTH